MRVSGAQLNICVDCPAPSDCESLRAGTACRASEIAETPLITAGQCDVCAGSVWWPPLDNYGVAYSISAVTWGRKPAGGCTSTDAAWSSACRK